MAKISLTGIKPTGTPKKKKKSQNLVSTPGSFWEKISFGLLRMKDVFLAVITIVVVVFLGSVLFFEYHHFRNAIYFDSIVGLNPDEQVRLARLVEDQIESFRDDLGSIRNISFEYSFEEKDEKKDRFKAPERGESQSLFRPQPSSKSEVLLFGRTNIPRLEINRNDFMGAVKIKTGFFEVPVDWLFGLITKPLAEISGEVVGVGFSKKIIFRIEVRDGYQTLRPIQTKKSIKEIQGLATEMAEKIFFSIAPVEMLKHSAFFGVEQDFKRNLREVMESGQKEMVFEAQLVWADWLARKVNFDSALKILQGLKEIKPEDPNIFFSRARIFESQENTSEAKIEYKAGFKRYPDDLAFALGASRLEMDSGNFLEAKSILEQVSKTNVFDYLLLKVGLKSHHEYKWLVHFQLGEIYLRENVFKKSENEVHYLLENHQPLVEVYYLLARSKMRQKLYSDALASLDYCSARLESEDFDQKRGDSAYLKQRFFLMAKIQAESATCAIHMNNFSDAQQRSNIAIKLNPDLADAYFSRGTAKHFMGQYEDAMDDYEKCIQKNSNTSEAYLNALGLRKSLKRPNRALLLFEKAEKRFGHDNNILVPLAWEYFREPDSVGGHRVVSKIHENSKDSPKDIIQLVKLLRMISFEKEALDILNGAPKIYLEDAEFNFELANSLVIHSKRQESREYLEKAIQLNPKFGSAYYLKGIVDQMDSKTKTALSNYTWAIKYGGENLDRSYLNRSKVWEQLGNTRKAKEDIEQCLKVSKDSQVIEVAKNNQKILAEK